MKIFISYKRDFGIDAAARIKEYFEGRGYSVFYDVESMRMGNFEKQIERNIKDSNYFILILSQGALDSEWVLKEIRIALDTPTTTIVPLIMPNYVEPANVPEDIKNALRHHGIKYDAVLFELVMNKLYNMISGEQKESKLEDKQTYLVKELYDIVCRIYNLTIDFRSSLKFANEKQLHNTIPALLNELQKLYFYYEKNKADETTLSKLALQICDSWNKLVPYYNSFANSRERMSITAQNDAKIAEVLFNEFVNIVLSTISIIKKDFDCES